MKRRIAFSVCMPYHDNPCMLAHHYAHLRSLPQYILDSIEMVVCDDVSELPIPTPTGLDDTVRLYRIPGPHIPWSHRVASNIAAHEARGFWFIMTDMDHVVPLETWRALGDVYRGKLRTDRAYTFTRRNADGAPYKPHPDSWLIHCSLWETIGGYDERYRGHYGQNYAFIERVRHHAIIDQLPVPLVRYSRDDIADASERVLTRKGTDDKAIIAAKRRQYMRDGTFYDDTRGSQPYGRIYP